MSARMIDKYTATIQWLAIAIIVISLIVLVQTLPLQAVVQALGNWIDRIGVWGPVVYTLLYVVATILFVPGSIPTLAGGAIFGLWIGLVTVSIGSTTGAMLAFLIARYLARGKVAAMARRNAKFGAIDRAIGEGGWRIVALLRLSPAVPFNIQNYLYGLTPIGFWPCLFASWLAMLPGTFMYVYLGHIAEEAVTAGRERTLGEWVLLVTGLLATVAVTVYVTQLARRKLAERSDIEREEELSEPAGQNESQQSSRSRTLSLAFIAVLMIAAAVTAQLHRDAIADSLRAWMY